MTRSLAIAVVAGYSLFFVSGAYAQDSGKPHPCAGATANNFFVGKDHERDIYNEFMNAAHENRPTYRICTTTDEEMSIVVESFDGSAPRTIIIDESSRCTDIRGAKRIAIGQKIHHGGQKGFYCVVR